jgi:hypothetical protein
MTTQELDDFLAHYGVKGMKWGIRKDRSSTTGRRSEKSDDRKTVDRLQRESRKKSRTLSNQELKLVNERLRLESEYRKLNPTTRERGKKRTQEVLTTAGIAVSAYQLAKTPVGQAGIKLGSIPARRLITSPAGQAVIELGKKAVTR